MEQTLNNKRRYLTEDELKKLIPTALSSASIAAHLRSFTSGCRARHQLGEWAGFAPDPVFEMVAEIGPVRFASPPLPDQALATETTQSSSRINGLRLGNP